MAKFIHAGQMNIKRIIKSKKEFTIQKGNFAKQMAK